MGEMVLLLIHTLKKYNVSSKIVFTEQKHGHSNLIEKYKISKKDYSIYSDKIKFDKYDWIIDGIFGIGLSRELNNKYIKLIEKLNINKNIISIDISSGLFTNNDSSKYFINSKYVITFGYTKFGHYINSVNNLHLVDIGFTNINKVNINLICDNDIYRIMKSFKTKK